jgi:hypothetical protein
LSFSVIPNSKTVHVLSHSEYPASSFAFAEHSNSQMLVADNTFIALMNKLKTLRAFETRLPKMEARGTRLEYQDFVINLGTVNQSQTTKGLILEVNYFSYIKIILSDFFQIYSSIHLGCICSNG